MKYIYLVLFFSMEVVYFLTIDLSDMYWPIYISAIGILLGLFIRLRVSKERLRQIGWGMLYGSIAAMLFSLYFVVLLYNAKPK
ncbi:hypothetical protein WSM22_31240 [Cytophagales bacterium WSM2-2]|nr:hypothetical protein WSM22_31240 [Cytophagales bacterium WSM2-2]